VALQSEDVTGQKPNEAVVAKAFGRPGRVVVVGEQPMFEAVFLTNQLVQLILYAPPGTTHRLEWTEDLSEEALWLPWPNQSEVTVTNLVTPLAPVPATNRTTFIRAVRQ